VCHVMTIQSEHRTTLPHFFSPGQHNLSPLARPRSCPRLLPQTSSTSLLGILLSNFRDTFTLSFSTTDLPGAGIRWRFQPSTSAHSIRNSMGFSVLPTVLSLLDSFMLPFISEPQDRPWYSIRTPCETNTPFSLLCLAVRSN
jgi:hypothetical protein